LSSPVHHLAVRGKTGNPTCVHWRVGLHVPPRYIHRCPRKLGMYFVLVLRCWILCVDESSNCCKQERMDQQGTETKAFQQATMKIERISIPLVKKIWVALKGFNYPPSKMGGHILLPTHWIWWRRMEDSDHDRPARSLRKLEGWGLKLRPQCCPVRSLVNRSARNTWKQIGSPGCCSKPDEARHELGELPLNISLKFHVYLKWLIP
jgi:hypothetical protein